MADVLLLAYHIGPVQAIPETAVDFKASEKWQRRANLLACMSSLPWKRLVWSGL